MNKTLILSILAISFAMPADARIMRPEIVRQMEFEKCVKKKIAEGKSKFASQIICKIRNPLYEPSTTKKVKR